MQIHCGESITTPIDCTARGAGQSQRRFSMTDFSTLPEKAQTRLSKISESVSEVVPKEIKSWKIQTNSLAEDGQGPAIIDEVKEWYEKKCLYLYTFQITSQNVAPLAVFSAYSDAKNGKKGDRAYARLNKESEWLYVGSSKLIYQRLKDHLGYSSKQTYAIHLAYWARSIDLEIKFECAKYPPGTSKIALQVLEDTLWEELLPMFGRQGVR